jgi:hypothetical protein
VPTLQVHEASWREKVVRRSAKKFREAPQDLPERLIAHGHNGSSCPSSTWNSDEVLENAEIPPFRPPCVNNTLASPPDSGLSRDRDVRRTDGFAGSLATMFHGERPMLPMHLGV